MLHGQDQFSARELKRQGTYPLLIIIINNIANFLGLPIDFYQIYGFTYMNLHSCHYSLFRSFLQCNSQINFHNMRQAGYLPEEELAIFSKLKRNCHQIDW